MRTKKVFWGLLILAIGILIWLGNLDLIAFQFSRDWPIILILIGVYYIIRDIGSSKVKNKKSTDKILKDLEDGKIDAKEAAEEIKKGAKK